MRIVDRYSVRGIATVLIASAEGEYTEITNADAQGIAWDRRYAAMPETQIDRLYPHIRDDHRPDRTELGMSACEQAVSTACDLCDAPTVIPTDTKPIARVASRYLPEIADRRANAAAILRNAVSHARESARRAR